MAENHKETKANPGRESQAPISDIQHPISKQKILIVDDKKANLIALEKVLREVDVEVIKAHNGNEALKATLNHDFALVLTDVQMPGMDGYELAVLLREESRTKHIPITFLTAERTSGVTN